MRDTTPPAIPTGLATLENVFEGATRTSRWHINWTPNTDGDLDHYSADVWYYDGFIYQHSYYTIDRGTTDLDLPGRTPGTTYYASVRAVDTSGNASIYCTPISVVATAADSPLPPSGLAQTGYGPDAVGCSGWIWCLPRPRPCPILRAALCAARRVVSPDALPARPGTRPSG